MINALQTAVYAALTGDAAVAALATGGVFDGPRPGAQAPFISIGGWDGQPDDPELRPGWSITFQLDCWSEVKGKREVNDMVEAVKAALHDVDLALDDGVLADLRLVLVRVLDDPDGVTRHGVLQFEALIEET